MSHHERRSDPPLDRDVPPETEELWAEVAEEDEEYEQELNSKVEVCNWKDICTLPKGHIPTTIHAFRPLLPLQ